MSVSGHTITIKNLIEIRPDNTIMIPGCEPISSLTSPTLAANMNFKGSVIDLHQALSLIPGSTITSIYNGGGALGTIRRFFVLPDGPPPSPANCSDNPEIPICRKDWYGILRENATPIAPSSQVPTTSKGGCEFFTLRDRSEIM